MGNWIVSVCIFWSQIFWLSFKNFCLIFPLLLYHQEFDFNSFFDYNEKQYCVPPEKELYNVDWIIETRTRNYIKSENKYDYIIIYCLHATGDFFYLKNYLLFDCTFSSIFYHCVQ
jgi:hypothetical protein